MKGDAAWIEVRGEEEFLWIEGVEFSKIYE